MKDTPYTTPEGFFEDPQHIAAQAMNKARSIRRRNMGLAASAFGTAACLLAVVTLFPVSSSETQGNSTDTTIYESAGGEVFAAALNESDEDILDIYDYDVFLRNF